MRTVESHLDLPILWFKGSLGSRVAAITISSAEKIEKGIDRPHNAVPSIHAISEIDLDLRPSLTIKPLVKYPSWWRDDLHHNFRARKGRYEGDKTGGHVRRWYGEEGLPNERRGDLWVEQMGEWDVHAPRGVQAMGPFQIKRHHRA
jgi:hypothetical protein